MTPPPDRSVADELAELDARINDLLPPRYQHCYEAVAPTSMGSAGLKYQPDGKVAWDQIWTTFCDLALAGGPPHRGTLLEPPDPAEVAAEPERQAEVAAEVARGIRLTTGAESGPGAEPGWVGVRCATPAEAGWLQLAVVAENVSARRRGSDLQLPAGPGFRPEKEIKNVVVALAKALHYWDGHLSDAQQALAGRETWDVATPAEVAADPAAADAARREIVAGLDRLGLAADAPADSGWVGVAVADEDEAVWLLRALLVDQVPARREGNVLFLPIDPTPGAGRAARAVGVFARAWDLRQASKAAAPPRRAGWRPSGRTG